VSGQPGAPASAASSRLQPFGTSIFSEMTALAERHGAINLSQGAPDFDGPADILAAAAEAMRAGVNQYARSRGLPALVAAIAQRYEALYGLSLDPADQITVTCGATEAIAASMLGLLEPGDEVILFEPFYDSYVACAAMAGARPRFCTLRFPDFAVDLDELARLFTARTKMIVVNSPHNPTGKVFRQDELVAVAELCQRNGVTVLTDEVYEHITFDGARHVPMATLPGMFERTVTLSSTGKTYSLTGWKIGWAAGPANLIAGVQAAHQFLTFCAPAPLQAAMAAALRTHTAEYTAQLRAEYAERRQILLSALTAAGFRAAVPRGTYFVLASFAGLLDGSDHEVARRLTETIGVAAIPPSGFYRAAPQEGTQLLRFSFCKRTETLRQAAERLLGLGR
jgi:N-succinyldiaminopimelate aminotransferase